MHIYLARKYCEKIHRNTVGFLLVRTRETVYNTSINH